ncbi:hypothetical protein, partial [Marinifilum sp. D737]|uniref:hypothetical protein n=1 Tax=Marinifilum sp. D737 TaxID=2969628 RepID=UPI0022742BDA
VDGETYYCEVTGIVGSCGTATSEKATLTIIKGIKVTKPIDLTITDGGNASFSVSVSGEPDYKYQWEENDGTGWKTISDGGKYSGAKTFELKITNALKAVFDGNQYRCVVNSTGAVCGSNATSSPATLNINTVLKIFEQPNNLVACLDDAIDFEITGTSAGLDYVWEYNDGRGTWS